MLLSELLNNVPTVQVIGFPELVEIDTITLNSAEAVKGSIFIAIKGYKTDGHKFITHAISNGVSAIVIEKDEIGYDQLLTSNKVVKILVSSSRDVVSQIANILYKTPSKKLNLIGITGTKGKTTTSYFIKNIFERLGRKSGLIGTNNNMIGELEIKTKLTTPESHVINKLMVQMSNAKCTDCIMEVSSHSLQLSRVNNLDFNIAVFTNITSDHLDFHLNFDNYLNAKKIFFDNLESHATIIYNMDDSNYEPLIKDSSAEKISYSLYSKADLSISNVEYDLEGTSFQITYLDETYKVETKLIGLFNVYNATAAIGAAVYSNITIDDAIKGIKTTPQVPGRFEVINEGNKKVIIDYSHTADSLQQALQVIHHIVKDERAVYTVFGCGGDRDKSKRPIMGKIAQDLNKVVYVTSDNPRSENARSIINDITGGMNNENYFVIEDREEAIKTAIENAEENAIILIAGKGHETYQEINGIRNFFSDKEVAIKYL